MKNRRSLFAMAIACLLGVSASAHQVTAEARVQKNKRIAVTIDHDVDETLAIVVRLDEKK